MESQLNMKLQMNYLQKDNWAHLLLKCLRAVTHIKFCTCDDSTPKWILACVGVCECNRTPFNDRPALIRVRTCAYKGVRNASFFGIFYARIKWTILYHLYYSCYFSSISFFDAKFSILKIELEKIVSFHDCKYFSSIFFLNRQKILCL